MKSTETSDHGIFSNFLGNEGILDEQTTNLSILFRQNDVYNNFNIDVLFFL